MISRRARFLALLLPLLLVTGCAGYLKDRMKDAVEVLEVSAGISVGVEANVRATKLLQAGFGSYNGDWAGLKNGRLAAWSEERVEMGVTPFYFHELIRDDLGKGDGKLVPIEHPLFGDAGFEPFMNDFYLLTDRGWFEAGITVNLICVGADLSVDLSEVFDFLAGIAGFDPLTDDAYGPDLETLVGRVNHYDSRIRAAAATNLNRRTGKRFGYVAVTPRDAFPDEQVDAWAALEGLARRGGGADRSRTDSGPGIAGRSGRMRGDGRVVPLVHAGAHGTGPTERGDHYR